MYNSTVTSYANAIFDLSVEQNSIQEWQKMLFVSSIVSKNSKVNSILYSRFLGNKKIANIFIYLCGDVLNKFGKRLIYCMSKYERLHLFPDIFKVFVALRLFHEGINVVEVVSSYFLTKTQKSSIVFFMKNYLSSNVILNCKIDKSIISGIIIRVGDMVLNYSVYNSIFCLKKFLKI
ncbi:MAG: ATP synthase F1 complex subunit delta [Candidatus Westeberhardia cardiocondylae]|nr:ATP synthase F1 complex subunit delta [Candidatus Westeberhardia cardiocondylae]